jgi:hypothetical protein
LCYLDLFEEDYKLLVFGLYSFFKEVFKFFINRSFYYTRIFLACFYYYKFYYKSYYFCSLLYLSNFLWRSLKSNLLTKLFLGELLGESAERLCIAFNITRQESVNICFWGTNSRSGIYCYPIYKDAYALRSHKLALDASASGKLLDRTPVRVPGAVNFVSEDNGIRLLLRPLFSWYLHCRNTSEQP